MGLFQFLASITPIFFLKKWFWMNVHLTIIFCSLKPLNSNYGMEVCNYFNIIKIANTLFLKSEYCNLNFFKLSDE